MPLFEAAMDRLQSEGNKHNSQTKYDWGDCRFSEIPCAPQMSQVNILVLPPAVIAAVSIQRDTPSPTPFPPTRPTHRRLPAALEALLQPPSLGRGGDHVFKGLARGRHIQLNVGQQVRNAAETLHR